MEIDIFFNEFDTNREEIRVGKAECGLYPKKNRPQYCIRWYSVADGFLYSLCHRTMFHEITGDLRAELIGRKPLTQHKRLQIIC